jgi:hypothetical protein
VHTCMCRRAAVSGAACVSLHVERTASGHTVKRTRFSRLFRVAMSWCVSVCVAAVINRYLWGPSNLNRVRISLRAMCKVSAMSDC